MVKDPKHTRDDGATAGKPAHEESSGLLGLADAGPPDPPTRLSARLRNYFLTGLIIVGPISITLYIVWWFIGLIDAWIKPLMPLQFLPEAYLPFTVPGIGLIIAIIALTVIGALAANLFGRTLIRWGEHMLGRMPVVRSVYNALKQIFETVLSKSGASFKEVALIEYPRRGIYCVVFISTETKGEIAYRVESDGGLVSVFLPTTPNPTSGFLLFVPRQDVTVLDMSVEEAAKLIISAGLVVPDHQERLAKLAEEAKGRRRKKKLPAPDTGKAPEPVGGR